MSKKLPKDYWEKQYNKDMKMALKLMAALLQASRDVLNARITETEYQKAQRDVANFISNAGAYDVPVLTKDDDDD